MLQTKRNPSENQSDEALRVKQFKSDQNVVFRSPLNDAFVLPNLPSKCLWHKTIDPKTTPHSKAERKQTTKILPDAIAAIGNTPLIKLNKIPQSAGLKCDVYVKCEFFNPGGSVKDRIAARVIEDAEKQGILKPGCTIIEPSSGNTGIGLALAAAVRGYRCIIVMSEKMSNEKVSTLKALGAEIVRTPITADSDSPEGMFGITYKLKQEIPNSVVLDQYTNPGNPLAHYDTTAEEIFDQCNGKVDMIIIGAGTGGTVTGIGRKFKEISPQTKIVAADPVGSILAQPETLNTKLSKEFYEVEGIGYDFLPTVLDRSVVDLWIKTRDEESLPMARRLIREEGLLCGSSSGAALVATLEAAKELKAGQSVVVILPDSIRNYLTKFVSDQWMEARKFQPCENIRQHWWWNENVTSINLQPLQTAHINMTCDRLMHVIKKMGVDQVPVVDNSNNVIGMVTMQNLMNSLIGGRIEPNESIANALIRIYPKVDKSDNIGLVSRILERESYVLITEKQESSKGGEIEKPVGIITAIDLLHYISTAKKTQ